MAGIYIHIPFCASRCIYCAFYSTTHTRLRRAYTEAVCREAEWRSDYLGADEKVETIYFGGGTPSQMEPELLSEIVGTIRRCFTTADEVEMTIECNPDDVTPEWAESIRRIGFNRASMGAQTFSDSRLRFIQRRHTSAQTVSAVKVLRHSGMRNISIDLMFGFPGQTLGEWADDIGSAIRLDVEHISAYGLTYEEGTRLHRMRERGEVQEADENLSAMMYEMLIDRLEQSGYEHYELSNFARSGFRSRHNSAYWKSVPYIGLGAAAHSYDGESRQWNVADAEGYIRIMQTERREGLFEREMLDRDTRYNDLVATSLRTSEGISLSQIERDFGSSHLDYFLANAKRGIENKLLRHTADRICLTRKALFISDGVICDMMMVTND